MIINSYGILNLQTDHLIPARKPDLIIINKKKRICKIVDLAVPADHIIKLKECEKKDKYVDLARELKKLWNMKVTIVPIVIGKFGTKTKGLLKRIHPVSSHNCCMYVRAGRPAFIRPYFIEQTMKTWRVELTAGGRSIAETKIQRVIFQGCALSPLLFIIAMMPLNHILRKCAAGYKLSRSQEKIKHLMYMDGIKLFAKN